MQKSSDTIGFYAVYRLSFYLSLIIVSPFYLEEVRWFQDLSFAIFDHHNTFREFSLNFLMFTDPFTSLPLCSLFLKKISLFIQPIFHGRRNSNDFFFFFFTIDVNECVKSSLLVQINPSVRQFKASLSWLHNDYNETTYLTNDIRVAGRVLERYKIIILHWLLGQFTRFIGLYDHISKM